MKNLLGIIATLLGILGMAFSAFWMMDERHAQKNEVLLLKKDLLLNELEIKADMLDSNIDDRNKVRKYYEDLRREVGGKLGEADEARNAYIEGQLEREYKEVDKIQDRIYELKK